MGIHSFKFGNFQAKILRRDHTLHQVWQLSRKTVKRYWVDIAWSAEGQTNQSTGAKEYALFFQREHKIWISKNLHSKCWCIKLMIFFKTTWKKNYAPFEKGFVLHLSGGRSVCRSSNVRSISLDPQYLLTTHCQGQGEGQTGIQYFMTLCLVVTKLATLVDFREKFVPFDFWVTRSITCRRLSINLLINHWLHNNQI